MEKVYSGVPWEKTVAYSRATKGGGHVFVSGTTAVDLEGRVVGPGDVYTQCKFIFEKIGKTLAELGGAFDDVVRTRTFITDIDRFDDFARAHAETFVGIDPAATCVEISRLVDPGLMVEIEVDAIIER
ncbi:Endoribonuclease L-PSP [Thiocapsa sp. KS1]|nr:RidA family protein [Thiocapsa sp. KS1]CRI67041.1 Endoribonuclease L-PSP [Thiocapsa sp. KS1]